MEKGGKRKIRLTDKEASILKFLFRAGNRAVARDVLLNEVWGYNAGVTTHTLETHTYRRVEDGAEFLCHEPVVALYSKRMVTN